MRPEMSDKDVRICQNLQHATHTPEALVGKSKCILCPPGVDT